MSQQRPPSRGMQRPTTASRPYSGAGRPPPSASGRAPGTASRLVTGAGRPQSRSQQPPGTARFGATPSVGNREIQEQGLTTAKGRPPGTHGGRVVFDKSYFMGLLRSKVTELHNELRRLDKEMGQYQEEATNYLQWEKRAEQLALEIKDSQGELSDYNILVDKLNTDASINEIQDEIAALKQQNDRESKNVEGLFQDKLEKEKEIKKLEGEVDKEKQAAANMLDNMGVDMKMKYENYRVANGELEQQLETMSKQRQDLEARRHELQEELSQSPIKQEAMRLYAVLHETELKREQMVEEEKNRLTPQQEREKLLKQVKDDNQEIAAMEKQSQNIKERIGQLKMDGGGGGGGGVSQVSDNETAEEQVEREKKYWELRKREEGMDEFLTTFENMKASDLRSKQQLEETIVDELQKLSKNLGHFVNLPSSQEFAHLQQNLQFKEREIKKSKETADQLDTEAHRLRDDLDRTEQLEDKIKSELSQLSEAMSKMEDEMRMYVDLDGLKQQAEERKHRLQDDRVSLSQKLGSMKSKMEAATDQYETLKGQLSDNDIYTQIVNLERKLQHVEQNNYAMKEFIAQKSAESDFTIIKNNVFKVIDDYNKFLQKHVVKHGTAAASYNQ